MLDAGEAFNGIGVLLHHANEERGLGVGACPALLPVLNSPWIGSQVPGEHGPGKVHALTQGEDFFGRDARAWIDGDGMRAQRSFALAVLGKGIEAFVSSSNSGRLSFTSFWP